MKRPFQLIELHPSDDVVETLEYLLREARDGKVIGIAYGAILKRRAYFVDAAGEAHRNPMFGVGIANVLTCDLLERARKCNKAA